MTSPFLCATSMWREPRSCGRSEVTTGGELVVPRVGSVGKALASCPPAGAGGSTRARGGYHGGARPPTVLEKAAARWD